MKKIKDSCKEAGNPMPEYTIKHEDIMVMFKSLVSGTDEGTNQDDDNSVLACILKVIQEKPTLSTKVRVHFSMTSIETMSDKIKRMLKMKFSRCKHYER